MARGGKVIFLSDGPGIAKMKAQAKPWASIALPTVDPFVAPTMLSVLAGLSCGRRQGTDVDQPRNLAKSVTVE